MYRTLDVRNSSVRHLRSISPVSEQASIQWSNGTECNTPELDTQLTEATRLASIPAGIISTIGSFDAITPTPKRPRTQSPPASPTSSEHDATNRNPATTKASSLMKDVEVAFPAQAIPPVPPIPWEHEEEAWRRRSYKRQSYTSYIAFGYDSTCSPMRSNGEAPLICYDDRHRSVSTKYGNSITITALPPKAKKPMEPSEYTSANASSESFGCSATGTRSREHKIRSWKRRKRWAQTLTASTVSFTITFASTTIAPASVQVARDYHIRLAGAPVTVGLFLLGLASGPLLSKAARAVLRQRTTYLVSMGLFALFTLASGLVKGLGGIIAFRLLAAIAASPCLSMSEAMLLDLWPPEDRSGPNVFYNISTFMGPVVGVVLGGYTAHKQGPYWTQYLTLFILAVCIVPIATISETSTTDTLRRNTGDGNPNLSNGTADKKLDWLSCFRALDDVPTLLLSLQSALDIATLYAIFIITPVSFKIVLGYDSNSAGVMFASMLIGLTVAVCALCINNSFFYAPYAEQWHIARAAEMEKARRMSTFRARSADMRSVVSVVSNFSRPIVRPTKDHRTSTATSINRASNATMSTARLGSASTSFHRASNGTAEPATSKVLPLPNSSDEQRNITLSVAAAKYLNSLEANAERPVLPERILFLLNMNPAFGDLCKALEGYHLRFDQIHLARILVDSLAARPTTGNNGHEMPAEPKSTLSRSKSLHRAAAAARLDMPAPPAPSNPHPAIRAPISLSLPPPPAEWRLWLALPASLLTPVSLLVLGWTTRPGIHWVAPCFAMAVLAGSLLLILIGSHQYLLDRFDDKGGANVLAGGMMLKYLVSFVFAMFALPLYLRVGMGWTMTFLALVSAVAGVVPWLLMCTRWKRMS